MLDREIEDLGFLPCVETLPQGSYAQVGLAVDHRTGGYVICKLCNTETAAGQQRSWLAMAKARGLRCVPKSLPAEGRWVVYQHARGSTLLQMAECQASDEQVTLAALASAAALFELAFHGMTHGDMHPGNVVIDRSSAMLIDPGGPEAQASAALDDADGLINAFCMAGFMSHHAARDCGVRIPAQHHAHLTPRNIRGVCDVFAAVGPMLRQASRAARRVVAARQAPGSGPVVENLTTIIARWPASAF